MCLGIPGKVQSIEHGPLRMGRVAFGGIVKQICLEYVPEAEVGDYVIVHVGFAISRLDEQEALRVFAYLDELGDLSELDGDRPVTSSPVTSSPVTSSPVTSSPVTSSKEGA